MRDFEIHAAIADAIERFANKVADELAKEANAFGGPTESALNRASHAIREAGKSNMTRRREARKASES